MIPSATSFYIPLPPLVPRPFSESARITSPGRFARKENIEYRIVQTSVYGAALRQYFNPGSAKREDSERRGAGDLFSSVDLRSTAVKLGHADAIKIEYSTGNLKKNITKSSSRQGTALGKLNRMIQYVMIL
jgi:hypothetical protein